MEDDRFKLREISKNISNDFSIAGIDSLISKNDFESLNEFKIYLTEKIKSMMDTKFDKLINTLYLIDVNEDKLKDLFDTKNREFIPPKLADLIIERQLQKFQIRQKYKRGEL